MSINLDYPIRDLDLCSELYDVVDTLLDVLTDPYELPDVDDFEDLGPDEVAPPPSTVPLPAKA